MNGAPLFQAFDAGWLAIGIGALLLIGALWWDLHRPDEPIHDDEDWDVEPRKRDPEADARHWPF